MRRRGLGWRRRRSRFRKRITVIDVSFKKNPEEKIVLINPEIVEREGKQVEEEGCLSLPEIREKVSRAAWVKVRAQDVTGEWFEVEGEELLARALQHEIDHLDGVLFIDRISRLKRELVMRKIRKLRRTASGNCGTVPLHRGARVAFGRVPPWGIAKRMRCDDEAGVLWHAGVCGADARSSDCGGA